METITHTGTVQMTDLKDQWLPLCQDCFSHIFWMLHIRSEDAESKNSAVRTKLVTVLLNMLELQK
jgi:hypothetical protein